MDSTLLCEQFSQFLEQQRGNILQDIAALVSIPSVYCEDGRYPFGEPCKRALDAALAMGAREGLFCRNYDDYCGEIWYGDAPASLAAAVHLDVVPAGDGWSYPPFELTQVGDFLVGRGTNDDKAPFVFCLYLLKFLKEKGLSLRHRIRLVCGCDEESGMRDLLHFAKAAELPAFTLVPDANFPLCYAEMGRIVLELTADWPLGPLATLESDGGDEQTPGRATIEFTAESGFQTLPVTGRATSSAAPEHEASALHRALRLIMERDLCSAEQKRLADFLLRLSLPPKEQGLGLDVSDPYNGPARCALGHCEIAQSRLVAAFSVRYPVTLDAPELFLPLQSAAAKEGFTVRVKEHLRPTFLPPEHPVVGLLEDACRAVTGQSQRAYPAPGATYTRRLPLGAAFGMDDLSQPKPFPEGRGFCHQPDECQHLPSLFAGAKIYLHALLRLDTFDFEALHPYRRDLSLSPTEF